MSVCLITYNHSAYVAAAIEGVLAQQTMFDWELVIADDYSTDGTREILTEYQRRYPEKIKLILQAGNVGPYRNWMDLMRYPKSKYVAYLEGDDYWVDKAKLQQQVDVLENDDTVAACGHNVDVLYVSENKVIQSESNVSSTKRMALADAGFGMPCHSCSLVIRNTPLLGVEWLAKIPLGDWPLISLLMKNGDLVVIPKVMAVYRQNTGTWSSMSRESQVRGILTTIDVMLQAPDFKSFLAFRKNLTYTKIQYLKELDATVKDANCRVNDSEIIIVNYYDEVVSSLQTAFKNKTELAARAPLGTLIKAVFAKINRRLVK